MSLKYTWSKQLEIKKAILELAERCKESCYKMLNSELLNELEDYVQMILVCGASSDDVVRFINSIDYIGIDSERNSDNSIILDKNLMNSGRLSDKNKADLYFKLSLKLLNFRDEFALNFTSMFKNYMDDFVNSELLINDGWKLLEVIMSYYISKMIFNTKNCFIGKSRFPSFILEDDTEISSIFRAIVNMFGQTINGIALKDDYMRDSIIDNLVVMAISGNFSQRIIGQYINENQEINLYKILYYLGILLNSKYKLIGLGNVDNINLKEEEKSYIFNQLYNICGNLMRISDSSVDLSSPVLIKNKKM